MSGLGNVDPEAHDPNMPVPTVTLVLIEDISRWRWVARCRGTGKILATSVEGYDSWSEAQDAFLSLVDAALRDRVINEVKPHGSRAA